MGCQCANKEEESKNEVLRKEQNIENEQYQLDNNNYYQKNGIFGLTNQDLENSTQLRAENKENDAELNQDQINNFNEQLNEEKNAKYSEYSEKMLTLINKIREDPVSYADIIEDSIQNIIEEQDKDDETKTRIIYKKKLKLL